MVCPPHGRRSPTAKRMIEFISFGSGSSGNCYYLLCQGYGLFIDAGISLRHIRRYFSDYGLLQMQPRALLITHDHTDHVKYAGALSQHFSLQVVATGSAFQGMQRNHMVSKKVPEELRYELDAEGDTLQLGPFSVRALPVPHDTPTNMAYALEADGVRFCLITDAGELTPACLEQIAWADYVVLESNYDQSMLTGGRYPLYLKRRISSARGHLDNVVAAEALASHLSPKARCVWLCHLSEENNHPEIARSATEQALSASGRFSRLPQVTPLRRKAPTGTFSLTSVPRD